MAYEKELRVTVCSTNPYKLKKLLDNFKAFRQKATAKQTKYFQNLFFFWGGRVPGNEARGA